MPFLLSREDEYLFEKCVPFLLYFTAFCVEMYSMEFCTEMYTTVSWQAVLSRLSLHCDIWSKDRYAHYYA